MSVMNDVSHNVLVILMTALTVIAIISLFTFVMWKFVLPRIDFGELIVKMFTR